MRVYLATSSRDIAIAEHWAWRLREVGIDVAHDWMTQIRVVGHANPPDATREQKSAWAGAALKAVADCDLLWLLIPQTDSVGCWIEYGYALGVSGGFKCPSVIASGGSNSTIFLGVADSVFDTHEQAFAHFTPPLWVPPCHDFGKS